MNNNQKIQIFFNKLDAKMTTHVPVIVSETAFKNFQNNFFNQSFDNIPWALAKKKKAERKTLLRQSGRLFGSLTQKLISPNRVIISAGSSQIPYARIHNEGGVIDRQPRSETFLRTRETKGRIKGRFKKGTISNQQGFTFSPYKITIPKRQYMGVTNALKTQIRNNIMAKLNEK
jgi:phage gpG-like protein